jgi:hypothetical protein
MRIAELGFFDPVLMLILVVKRQRIEYSGADTIGQRSLFAAGWQAKPLTVCCAPVRCESGVGTDDSHARDSIPNRR